MSEPAPAGDLLPLARRSSLLLLALLLPVYCAAAELHPLALAL
jgi:hypothetical protein